MPFPFFNKNMFKDDLRNGEIKFGTFSRSTLIDNTEIITELGYDFIVYDMIHGLFTDNEIRCLIKAARMNGAHPIVRVSGPEEGKIIHVLDFGAEGIIIPCVDNPLESKEAADMTKFFPIGKRGLNGASPEARHGLISVPEYMKQQNDKVMTMVMIETKHMAEHIEELCKIDTIDGFFIGPNDLSVSLGIPGKTSDPLILEVMRHVIKVARDNGKIVGAYSSSTEAAKRFIDYGATMISYSNDFKLLQKEAKRSLEELKSL